MACVAKGANGMGLEPDINTVTHAEPTIILKLEKAHSTVLIDNG